jgi:hypothetical protein
VASEEYSDRQRDGVILRGWLNKFLPGRKKDEVPHAERRADPAWPFSNRAEEERAARKL